LGNIQCFLPLHIPIIVRKNKISYNVGYRGGVGMNVSEGTLGAAKGHLLKSRIAFSDGDYEHAASQAIMAFNIAEYADIQTNSNALRSMIDMAEKKINKLEKSRIRIA
jgi:hypothetical protein